MICCASSCRARRTSIKHCTSESSVTAVSGQRTWINSALQIRRPGFSTKYFKASKGLGRSLTSCAPRSRQPRVRSRVKPSKQSVWCEGFCIRMCDKLQFVVTYQRIDSDMSDKFEFVAQFLRENE